GCQPGSPLDCDDHVFCTADSCVTGVGCTHTPIANCCVSDADCDDGNFCNGLETCVDNQCTPGAAPSCDDHNGCTDDSCDPQLGCLHVPNTDPCDDGNACTTDDTCSDGECVGGPPRNCDDSNGCTDDSCDPATGCVQTPNTASCDDGDACTQTDTCQSGVCTGGAPVVCTASDQCHVAGTWIGGAACSSNPQTANGTACHDGNAC